MRRRATACEDGWDDGEEEFDLRAREEPAVANGGCGLCCCGSGGRSSRRDASERSFSSATTCRGGVPDALTGRSGSTTLVDAAATAADGDREVMADIAGAASLGLFSALLRAKRGRKLRNPGELPLLAGELAAE